MRKKLAKLKSLKYPLITVIGLFLILLIAPSSWAANLPEICSETVDKECLEYVVDAINNLWVLIAAILVFAMQLGFALLEAGFSPAKNTVNVLFKNVADACLGILVFFLFGYALMYSSKDGLWYELITLTNNSVTRQGAEHLSVYIDFFFQAAFAATAATICSGAVAGRIKPIAYLGLTVFITGFVYPISGSLVWGGVLPEEIAFHDFAGSIVVHSVGGAAALACVIILGPRKGRFRGRNQLSRKEENELKPHSLPLAAMGTLVLWIGWYGFNAGSALGIVGSDISPEKIGLIILNTTLAACASAFTVIVWKMTRENRKVDLSTILNGILGGLVGITASCDIAHPLVSLVIGGASGVIVIKGVELLSIWKVDDAVGAIPVHCFCGIGGGLATFLSSNNPGVNLNYMFQLLGSFLIPTFSFIAVFIVFKLFDFVFGIRVSLEKELDGLDWQEHGEISYLSLERDE